MSTIQETVFSIIAKEAGIAPEKVTLDATLADLQIESLDAIQIIFEIEDRYKITLPERDPKFDTATVRGLVDAVERLVSEQQSAAGSAPTDHAS